MKDNRQVAWWCLAAVSIIVSSSAIGWMGYDTFTRARDNHLESNAHKLVDCTNSLLSVQFQMPKAEIVHLVLGFHRSEGPSSSSDSQLAHGFVGKVVIRREGTNVVSFPIEYSSSQSCDWLSGHGVAEAYVLNWSDQKPRLADKLQTGETYELRLEFTENTPTNGSLWANLLQRHGDAARQGSIVVAPEKQ